MTEELRTKLQGMVDSHDIVLFMKGNRQQPQCGFSARVVSILEELEIDYQTYNVFSDPDIRRAPISRIHSRFYQSDSWQMACYFA